MTDPISSLNAALEGRYRFEHPLGVGGIERVELDLAGQVEQVDFDASDRTYQLMVEARSKR